MEHTKLTELLNKVAQGEVSVEKAALELKTEPFEDLGFAKLDHHRKIRQGAAEVIYGAGKTPEQILKITEADAHQIELAQIAGYMHDIGNCINRQDHAHSGAILAYSILKELDMPLSDRLTIVTAIGHHDEKTGTALDPVSAALILADKTDVRRNRVQNPVIANFDIHDRVNYAALSSSLEFKTEKKIIQMNLELDDSMCTVMDYFGIFLERMMMCRRAAEVLGWRFKLVANGSKLC